MVKYYISSDLSDYLKHEGIQGMKWGQRNGPPYPLTAKQFSKAEKRAGAVVSRWTAKANKEIQKAQKRQANAKNDRQLNKANRKTETANTWKNKANALNNKENPFIRKSGEDKKDQQKRIGEAYSEFSRINDHYGARTQRMLVTALAGGGAGMGMSIQQYGDFKAYANVYMKQPADAFVEESKKK